jgi:hypothetical protein
MNEINLKSWDEFSGIVREIREKYGYHELLPGNDSVLQKNILLFRGQRNAEWHLQTTLERQTNDQFDVKKYLLYATYHIAEIESFTGDKWNSSYGNELIQDISTSATGPISLPAYDYLVYLRHHGFPSPLLDWTESPYIAAYFAFHELPEKDGRAAIYAYVDSIDGAKVNRVDEPRITVRGPNVRTHKRHFAQKAWYTIATKWNESESKHFFCSHHDVVNSSDGEQDLLMKITLPVSERKAALTSLNDFNINHYTLFQTEDSLIKAIAMKKFDLGQ